MLGRKTYTAEEIAAARAAVDQQLTTFRALAAATSGDPAAAAVVDDVEVVFFNNMTIVLDRYFIHRVRPVTGKDINPVNEVELLADSLMNNKGVLRTGTVIKYVQDQSILKIGVGEPIRLTAAPFEALAKAFFAELERRFGE